ncbi:hypothetical protein BJX76DRAFT_31013 [Aspergillus varians]
MHRLVVPKLSPSHRFACLALYRALLRQCNGLQRTSPQLISAQSHIRERFHRYKSLQSPSQTANALKAGYEALDLLHSASQGNKDDSGLIATILSDAHLAKQRKREFQAARSKLQPVKQPSKHQLKAEENQRFQDTTDQPHPEATSILSRPRPVVNGQRHIPVLVNAGGVPFLRIKKPQPKSVSRVIRTKLKKRWSWIERFERLKIEILFGKDEDYWDSLTTGLERDTWAGEIKTALNDVSLQIHNNDIKNKALAESMWKVVLAERKLAEEEKLRAEQGKQIAEGKKHRSTDT